MGRKLTTILVVSLINLIKYWRFSLKWQLQLHDVDKLKVYQS